MASVGNAVRGGELYRIRCIECHDYSLTAAATGGGALFGGQSSQQIAQTLREYQDDGGMVLWWTESKVDLSDQEISDLSAYIEDLQGPP